MGNSGPKALFSKYSIYMFATVGEHGEPVMILHYNTTLTPSSKAIYSGTKYYDTHIEFHSLFLDASSGTELLIIVVLLSCISKLHVTTTIPKPQLN